MSWITALAVAPAQSILSTPAPIVAAAITVRDDHNFTLARVPPSVPKDLVRTSPNPILQTQNPNPAQRFGNV